MLQQCAEVRELADESLVETIFQGIKQGEDNHDAVTRWTVEKGAELTGDGRERLRRRLERTDLMTDRINRALACAARGLINAQHLYGRRRLLTWQTIRDAKPEALAVIADPQHEFIIVEDDGTSRLVIASRLSYREVSRVWDLHSGAITEKEQRKRLCARAKLRPGANDGDGTYADILSATPCGDGTQIYVFDVGGEELRLRLPVAKIRKFSGA